MDNKTNESVEINKKIRGLYFLVVILLVAVIGMGIFIGTSIITRKDGATNNTTNNVTEGGSQNISGDDNEMLIDKDAQMLFSITDYAIKPLDEFKNDNNITVNDLSDEIILDYSFRYIFEHELYVTHKYDNLGETNDDNVYEISVDKLSEISNNLFGKTVSNYPDAFLFEYRFIGFSKTESIYSGKVISTGALASPGYEYVLVNSRETDNILTLNVLAAYDDIGAVYKDDSLTEMLFDDYNWKDIVQNNPKAYQDKLINLDYIFEITDTGYKFNSIKVK